MALGGGGGGAGNPKIPGWTGRSFSVCKQGYAIVTIGSCEGKEAFEAHLHMVLGHWPPMNSWRLPPLRCHATQA